MNKTYIIFRSRTPCVLNQIASTTIYNYRKYSIYSAYYSKDNRTVSSSWKIDEKTKNPITYKIKQFDITKNDASDTATSSNENIQSIIETQNTKTHVETQFPFCRKFYFDDLFSSYGVKNREIALNFIDNGSINLKECKRILQQFIYNAQKERLNGKQILISKEKRSLMDRDSHVDGKPNKWIRTSLIDNTTNSYDIRPSSTHKGDGKDGMHDKRIDNKMKKQKDGEERGEGLCASKERSTFYRTSDKFIPFTTTSPTTTSTPSTTTSTPSTTISTSSTTTSTPSTTISTSSTTTWTPSTTISTPSTTTWTPSTTTSIPSTTTWTPSTTTSTPSTTTSTSSSPISTSPNEKSDSKAGAGISLRVPSSMGLPSVEQTQLTPDSLHSVILSMGLELVDSKLLSVHSLEDTDSLKRLSNRLQAAWRDKEDRLNKINEQSLQTYLHTYHTIYNKYPSLDAFLRFFETYDPQELQHLSKGWASKQSVDRAAMNTKPLSGGKHTDENVKVEANISKRRGDGGMKPELNFGEFWKVRQTDKRAMMKSEVKAKNELFTIESLAKEGRLGYAEVHEIASILLSEQACYPHTPLPSDVAKYIAEELGVYAKLFKTAGASSSHPRPPIATILGHVDHGKTTLLDTLRKSSVVNEEVGGITQKVSAFSCILPATQKQVTFVDTPGHSAFGVMRQRGASVADVAIVVVSAGDGVMPQTREVLMHVKNNKEMKMVVAVTKMDMYSHQFDLVKEELEELGISDKETEIEKVQIIPISAKEGMNMDKLEIALMECAASMNLRYNEEVAAEVYVLESRFSSTTGASLQGIVKNGIIKTGDWLVSGDKVCRLKRLTNERGVVVESGKPSEVVEIFGWTADSAAGECITAATDKEEATKRACVRKRVAERLSKKSLGNAELLEDFKKRLTSPRHNRLLQKWEKKVQSDKLDKVEEAGGCNEFSILVKARDQGSLDALLQWVEEFNVQKRVAPPSAILEALGGYHQIDHWNAIKIVDASVGDITLKDVRLCEINKGTLIAFDVKHLDKVKEELESKNILHHSSNIIYRLFEKLTELYESHYGEGDEVECTGKAVVTKVGYFTDQKSKNEKHTVLGVTVKEGRINLKNTCDVIRNGKRIVVKASLLSIHENKKPSTELCEGAKGGAIILKDGLDGFEKGDEILLY